MIASRALGMVLRTVFTPLLCLRCLRFSDPYKDGSYVDLKYFEIIYPKVFEDKYQYACNTGYPTIEGIDLGHCLIFGTKHLTVLFIDLLFCVSNI